MSLDRSHPVFLGCRLRDRTPPRHRARCLDDETGYRTFSWKLRRYVCILGDNNTGRRTLARRFFRDLGELRVDGNYWMRGRISMNDKNPFPRGQLDLLIRIVPSPVEEVSYETVFGRTLISAGIHGNAELFVVAFVCAKAWRLLRVEDYYAMFLPYLQRHYTRSLIVGTKCDLRVPGDDRFMSEEEIKDEIEYIFTRYGLRRQRPTYIECSILNNVNVLKVLDEILSIIVPE